MTNLLAKCEEKSESDVCSSLPAASQTFSSWPFAIVGLIMSFFLMNLTADHLEGDV